MTLRKIVLGLLVLLTVAYPFLIYFFLGRIEPRWLLACLACIWLVRSGWAGMGMLGWGLVWVTGGLFAWGGTQSVLLYPVVVNAFFLIWFASTLKYPPTMVERVARLMDPDLPPEGVRYTRQVTWVWCGFFLLNGLLAATTVVMGDVSLWTWYNGLVAYLLMGALMAGEYLVRRKIMRANGHA